MFSSNNTKVPPRAQATMQRTTPATVFGVKQSSSAVSPKAKAAPAAKTAPFTIFGVKVDPKALSAKPTQLKVAAPANICSPNVNMNVEDITSAEWSEETGFLPSVDFTQKMPLLDTSIANDGDLVADPTWVDDGMNYTWKADGPFSLDANAVTFPPGTEVYANYKTDDLEAWYKLNYDTGSHHRTVDEFAYFGLSHIIHTTTATFMEDSKCNASGKCAGGCNCAKHNDVFMRTHMAFMDQFVYGSRSLFRRYTGVVDPLNYPISGRGALGTGLSNLMEMLIGTNNYQEDPYLDLGALGAMFAGFIGNLGLPVASYTRAMELLGKMGARLGALTRQGSDPAFTQGPCNLRTWTATMGIHQHEVHTFPALAREMYSNKCNSKFAALRDAVNERCRAIMDGATQFAAIFVMFNYVTAIFDTIRLGYPSSYISVYGDKSITDIDNYIESLDSRVIHVWRKHTSNFIDFGFHYANSSYSTEERYTMMYNRIYQLTAVTCAHQSIIIGQIINDFLRVLIGGDFYGLLDELSPLE